MHWAAARAWASWQPRYWFTDGARSRARSCSNADAVCTSLSAAPCARAPAGPAGPCVRRRARCHSGSSRLAARVVLTVTGSSATRTPAAPSAKFHACLRAPARTAGKLCCVAYCATVGSGAHSTCARRRRLPEHWVRTCSREAQCGPPGQARGGMQRVQQPRRERHVGPGALQRAEHWVRCPAACKLQHRLCARAVWQRRASRIGCLPQGARLPATGGAAAERAQGRSSDAARASAVPLGFQPHTAQGASVSTGSKW